MKKFTNKKGFTLVEMLIVVAIIAVLAAVAIPSATSALDKANKGADDANLRTAKSLAAVEAVDIAADHHDTDAHIYFLDCSTSTAVLVPVEEWDTSSGDMTMPDDSTYDEIPDKAYGLSKDNTDKLIKVVISVEGELTTIAWTKGQIPTP